MSAPVRRSLYLVVGSAAGLAAIAGVAGIWAGAATFTGTQCAWIAPLAALDAALLLRLSNWPRLPSRAWMTLAITLATIVLANLFVAAALIGRAMGMRPLEAVSRMSFDLAWLHAASNTGAGELAFYALALAVAWMAGR